MELLIIKDKKFFVKKMNFKKGFTLIEILAVVAIIGILASIVLASLNTARQKGADAAIKSTLSNSRTQAELFYQDNAGRYANVCSDPNGISKMLLNAAEKLTSTPIIGTNNDNFVYDPNGSSGSVVCHDSDTAWAAVASLKVPSLPDTGWCVDSTGASKEEQNLPANTTVCP